MKSRLQLLMAARLIELRPHYIRQAGRRKDWKAFFAAMHRDPPIAEIADWVRQLASDHRIVIMTGRPEQYRRVTIAWLERFAIPWDELYMRPVGDHRPDYIVKREMLNALGEARNRVEFVIDDRPAVCDMWRQAGLKCHQVGTGDGSPDYQ